MVSVPGRPQSAPQVHEGTAHLQPGDHLIFFTNGVTSLRKRRFGAGEYQWLDILMRDIERTDTTIQTSLLSTLSKYQKNAADDLTAVVLRMEQSQAVAQEGVA
jgi:serine phosphatase RsbU (regulator of sigma subunit)